MYGTLNATTSSPKMTFSNEEKAINLERRAVENACSSCIGETLGSASDSKVSVLPESKSAFLTGRYSAFLPDVIHAGSKDMLAGKATQFPDI